MGNVSRLIVYVVKYINKYIYCEISGQYVRNIFNNWNFINFFSENLLNDVAGGKIIFYL